MQLHSTNVHKYIKAFVKVFLFLFYSKISVNVQ